MISAILKKYNNSGHERSRKAKRNIAAAFLIKGGSIVVNLALVPLTIKYLSTSEYGVWITLSSIILWFSFFDIGLGHGLRNRLAEAIAKNDERLGKVYISTTYALLSILVCVIWLLFLAGNAVLDWSRILNAPPQLRDELSRVALIVFTFFCIQFVLRLIGTILAANQQAARSASFDFFASLLSLICIFIFSRIQATGSLTGLALITSGSQLVVLATVTLLFFRGSMARYRPSLKAVDFKYSRSLMGLGAKFFIIQLAGIFVFQCTNVVITQLMGPEQVTVYSIAFRYFSVATMLATIVTVPFWSAFTEAYVKGDFDWMRNIVKKLNLFFIAILGVVGLMLALSSVAYQVWVGGRVTVGWEVSILMAINVVLTIRWNLFIALINGTGKLRLQLILNVIMSFCFVPIAILLGKSFSLSGIVIANILINLVYAILVPLQSNKILNKTASGIWDKN